MKGINTKHVKKDANSLYFYENSLKESCELWLIFDFQLVAPFFNSLYPASNSLKGKKS